MKICTENECEKVSNWEKVRHLLNSADLLAVRLTMGTASLLFGVMLLWAGDSFTRPAFAVVKTIMPELSWGWLFVVNGISTIYSLFCGLRLRMCFYFGGVLGSILWTMMSIGMLFSATLSHEDLAFAMPAASAPALAFMFASWWVLYRYPRDLK